MGSLAILASNINVMENIYTACLSNVSHPVHAPHINIPLFPHQQACLARMKNIEESLDKGFVIGDEMMYTSYAILGERPGTGKTLTILAHISQMALMNPTSFHLHPASTPSFFSLVKETTTLLPTLIVVPHTLLHQWRTEIEKTTLSYFTFKSVKDIDAACIPRLMTSHITLIPNTLLKPLSSLLHALSTIFAHIDYEWTRVIYDEADTIRIPPCQWMKAKMTWLVTSRYTNIIYANQHIHSHVVKQLHETYIDNLTDPVQDYVRRYIDEHPKLTIYKTVSEAYFKSILNDHPSRGYFVVMTEPTELLPPISKSTHFCTPPPSTARCLESGQIEEAVLSIHPTVMSLETLLATADSNVKSRLSETACSICYESASVPCVTPCCKNLFCGKCIVTWFQINAKCPLCQTALDPSSLIKLKTSYIPSQGKTKLDILRELLKEPNRKTLVFSRTVKNLRTSLKGLPGIDAIYGNSTLSAKKINAFTTGETRTLLISEDTYGINLQAATHLILMDPLSDEDHIVGLAQRIGRRQPLVLIEIREG